MLDAVVDAAPVAAALGSLQRRIGDMSAPWEQIGAEAVEATLPFVPVLTGALADTLQAAGGRDGVDVSAGGPGVVYARIQNARHHFMDNAADAVESDAPGELEDEIRSLIRLVGLD
jgi:hypothetical protein